MNLHRRLRALEQRHRWDPESALNSVLPIVEVGDAELRGADFEFRRILVPLAVGVFFVAHLVSGHGAVRRRVEVFLDCIWDVTVLVDVRHRIKRRLMAVCRASGGHELLYQFRAWLKHKSTVESAS